MVVSVLCYLYICSRLLINTQACQRVYDWHSSLAQAADKVVAAWFESDEFSDDEGRAAWASWALDEGLKLPFVFEYLNSRDVRFK